MLLHPLMLAWLGGAAVPLVLHLLSRSRFRAVHWGAMMFLTGRDAGPRHTARIRQWILLFLRMATVGLLAVALARPVISARHSLVPTAGLTTGSSAAVVIILDDSPSMGYTANGKSRLDAAREVTLQILSALKRGDQAALLLAGNHDFQPPTATTPDLQSIASRVSDLQPDINQPDFAAELTRAADLLEHAGPVDREIYIISDRQALPWRNVLTDSFQHRWQERKSAGPLPRVTVFPVGGDESDNLAVEGIDFTDRPVFSDVPNTLQIRVRNFGSAAVNDVPLSVWTGTEAITDTTISVPPRSVRSVTLPVLLSQPGSQVISAAVRSTGLTTDDRMDVSVDVLEQIEVLLVESPAASPTTRPTTRPIPALLSKGFDDDSPYNLTTAPLSAINPQLLKKTNVLILDNLARVTGPQAKVIQHFADAGGGVLIITGNATRAGECNGQLHGNGINLLPAMLKGIVSKPTHIATIERQHPVFHHLSGKPDPFTATPISHYFQVSPYASEGHILAKLASGDPLLVESNVGRGHVLLMTTSLDHDWSALPQSSAMPQLMQSMVRYLGANAAVDRNLWPGQTIVVSSDEPPDSNSATVQALPAVTRDPMTATHAGDRTELRYGNTSKPGTYRVRCKLAGEDLLLNYVVSAGHGSSDLTPLSDAQWKVLTDRVKFDRVDLAHTTVANTIDSQRGGREVWIDLLVSVRALLAIERLLARWWSD